jgi:hypothetical protein
MCLDHLDVSFGGLARVTITSILSETDAESLRDLTFVVCFVMDSDTCAESFKVLTRCTVSNLFRILTSLTSP